MNKFNQFCYNITHPEPQTLKNIANTVLLGCAVLYATGYFIRSCKA